MKLSVPEPLKVLLVDDWEAVTKNNQVRIIALTIAAGRLTLRNDRSLSVCLGNRTWLSC